MSSQTLNTLYHQAETLSVAEQMELIARNRSDPPPQDLPNDEKYAKV